MFFAEATHVAPGPAGSSDKALKHVAESMDNLYGWGGFSQYPFSGTITESGHYTTEEDPDLMPMATLYSRGFICYIYPYSIVGIKDPDTGEAFIARFD
jgi:hypothetical protein